MRSVGHLIAIGAALMPFVAYAADAPQGPPPPPAYYPPPPAYVPPPPPPPVPCCDDFGGWYLRGDIGFSNQQVKSLYNVLNDSPGTTVVPVHYDFDSAPTFGVGLGYQWNGWIRSDATIEYRGKANFHGLEIIKNGGAIIGTDEYRGSKSEWLGLINVYADLGTWWCITPFIGVGAGASRTSISNFTDINTPNGGVAYALDAHKLSFAYAAYAGLAYKVSRNFTVELAYRYLNIGDANTGDLITYTGINSVKNPTTFQDISSHDLRLGVRLSLEPGEAPPAPPFIPPMVRSRG